MWYNVIIAWILKSPLHRLLSQNTLLLEYMGRRSGKAFETPVNYVDLGDELLVTSLRQRTWWRNFMGSAPVRIWLLGKAIDARAIALVEPNEVAHYLEKYLAAAPQIAKYFRVRLDPQGHPNPSDIQLAAGSRIIVRILLELS